MSQLKAVIFGAIGTIAETSDIQRQAFNKAFQAAGLDWNWNAETYRDLLKLNGGQTRIRAYRDANLANVEIADAAIADLHQAKTTDYVAMLDRADLQPRLGVVELIDACINQNIQVAFCTSTSRENVNGLKAALAGILPFERFATIVTIDRIDRIKPAPDAYLYCLQQLGLNADEAIAIEDTPVSMAAAQTAGILTIATPGAATSGQDFSAADLLVANLTGMSVDGLSALLARQPAAVSI